MKKAVVYASTTGNTEQMAQAIAEGAKAAGADVLLATADGANASDVLILGSPAMGAEVLEDSMESFFSGIEGQLSGKKVALFGSYDWGDCQFLRDWAARVTGAGATMLNGEGLAAHLTPEAADLDACKELGKTAQ